jgi:hypothetical protein
LGQKRFTRLATDWRVKDKNEKWGREGREGEGEEELNAKE